MRLLAISTLAALALVEESSALCPPPSAVGNGTVSPNTAANTGDSSVLICDEGFQPTGESTIVCSANGAWVGEESLACESILSGRGDGTSGAVDNFDANTGKGIGLLGKGGQGGGRPVVECDVSLLTIPANAFLDANGTVPAGASVGMECETGFVEARGSVVAATCQADGTWDADFDPAACLQLDLVDTVREFAGWVSIIDSNFMATLMMARVAAPLYFNDSALKESRNALASALDADGPGALDFIPSGVLSLDVPTPTGLAGDLAACRAFFTEPNFLDRLDSIAQRFANDYDSIQSGFHKLHLSPAEVGTLFSQRFRFSYLVPGLFSLDEGSACKMMLELRKVSAAVIEGENYIISSPTSSVWPAFFAVLQRRGKPLLVPLPPLSPDAATMRLTTRLQAAIELAFYDLMPAIVTSALCPRAYGASGGVARCERAFRPGDAGCVFTDQAVLDADANQCRYYRAPRECMSCRASGGADMCS